MLADGSRYYSGSLLFGFGNNEFSHDTAIVIVQMTDRLIQKQEIERLAERADKGDTLLLPERKFTGFGVCFICDTQLLEKSKDFLFFLYPVRLFSVAHSQKR